VAEKRMLIVPAELAKKIDDNRGDISQAEFIEFLIDNQLTKNQLIHFLTDNQTKEETKEQKYATKEEIRSFEQDIKKLLIDNQIKEEAKEQKYATKEEIRSFEQDIKKLLIDNQIKEETKEQKYVTKEEIRVFEQDIKSLLRRSLDFFVSYGLELGKHSPKIEFEELSSRLSELENDLASEDKSKEAKIKWK